MLCDTKKPTLRFLSFLLSAVMFCAMFTGLVEFTSFETSAYDPTAFSIPTSGTTSSMYFRTTPAVLEVGDGYLVIWSTSFCGTGYIEYTYNGVKYTVYDEENGVIRTYDTVHAVKVPHEHLLGNSYTVYSQHVSANNATTLTFSTKISCGPLTLRKYASESSINVLQFTDTHSYIDHAKAVAKQFSTTPDLIVMTGDIANYIKTKDMLIDSLFGLWSAVSGGQYPIVYCRGNHETRGRYASMLLEYYRTETGEMYFDFEYGPLYGLVLDTGEDKVDSHTEYGGVVNFKEYLQEEREWLSTLKPNDKTYRLLVYHIPDLSDMNDSWFSFVSEINSLGMQFGICGHYHDTIWKASGSYGLNFPQLVMGGDPYTGDVTGAMLKFTGGNSLNINVISQTGTKKLSKTISLTSSKTSSVTYTAPNHGLNMQTTLTTLSLSFLSQPVVFETGDEDYYTVCWATSVNTLSYVEYTYQGTLYQIHDEIGGERRTFDKLHSVKVPKEHLNNNIYRIGAVQCTRHDPNHHARGNSCVSNYYVFENRNEGAAVKLYNLPNITAESALTSMSAAIKELGTSPALIIANGDVRSSIYNEDAIVNFLSSLATVSDSSHPVLFVRGEGDSIANQASRINKYLKYDNYYYTFSHENYQFVVLDTLAKSSSHAGMLTFDTLLKEENEWVNSLTVEDGKKLVVISHVPLDTFKSQFGYDWQTVLENKGACVFISGNDTAGNVSVGATSGGTLSIEGGGYNASSTKSTAVEVILSGNYARVNAINNSGTTVISNSYSLFDGTKVPAVSAVAPTLSNGAYLITDPSHLVWMSQNIANYNGFEGMSFKLAKNIDMKLIPFTPIGGNSSEFLTTGATCSKFKGAFDGNGKIIYNLYVDTAVNYGGLFGYAQNATIKNLAIIGGSIVGESFLSALAGALESSTVVECYTDVEIFSRGTEKGSKLGGIAGMSSGSTIQRCANYGTVSTDWITAPCIGGLVGQVCTNTATNIINSYNRGDVIVGADQADGAANSSVGGLVGHIGSASIVVTNCYNTAETVSYTDLGAGIAGDISSAGAHTFTNCYYLSGNANKQTAFSSGTNDWSSTAGSGTISSKSASAMKSASFATTLNSSAFTYDASANDGYPTHAAYLEFDLSGGVYSITVDETLGVYISGGILYGVAAGDSADEIRTKIENTSGITVNGTGTGATVTLTVDGYIVDTVTLVVIGDLDGDGRITSADYNNVKTAMVSDDAPVGIYAHAADANGDGLFTSGDALIIAACVKGDVSNLK